MTPGEKFRAALVDENPLQIVGAINAYTAILAKNADFKALYLSGAGVANYSYGVPDTGKTSLADVLIDVKRITSACDLPLLVDVDTGWEEEEGVAETIRQMERVGVAAVQIEDQQSAKLCGHLPGKQLVTVEQMVKRVKTAVSARDDDRFAIMARTDAYAVEGLESAIERAKQYVTAGADMIFAESLKTISDYQTFCAEISVPVLANLTEFGQTPFFHLDELKAVGVSMVLYPLSAARAMNKAALHVYQAIKEQGTQQEVVCLMQTRDELYQFLDYDVTTTKE
ncbi:unnamed protein product [marine sediment metagenome]|uniref:Methylisocitrate lyase n=1 Tax=marine sediment metagenome TaxID=412755 RepID=X0RUT0_9ZZZZ